MFIVRGVKVFPPQVETAPLAAEEIRPHHWIVLTRESGLDQTEIRIEVYGEPR